MPVKETVTIEVEATGDGLRKIATDAKHANKALKRTSDEGKKAGSTFAKNAELAERMRSALGPLGDVLGDVTGGADDFATALEGFSAKQVAAAAGSVAVAAALLKTGAAVLDVVVNLEQYEDQIQRLQEAGDITEGQVEGLREASAAVSALSDSFSDLAIMIAGEVAPVIEDFSRGVVALKGFFEGGFDGMNKAAQRFNARQREIKKEQDEARNKTGKAESDATKQHEQQADRRIAAIGRVRQAEQEALRERLSAEKELQAMAGSLLFAEADEREKIALSYDKQIARTYELAEAHAHLAGMAESVRESYMAQRDAAIEAYDASQRSAEQAQVATFNTTEQAVQMAEAIKSQAAAFKEQVDTLLGAINDLFNQSMQAQIAAAEKGSAREKQLMREQFRKNKEFAIAQAGINMALGIVNALATTPFPANIVMAALVAATGAVQIGLIASKKNPYHRGGIEQLAPDERVGDSGRSVTRNNEVSLHVTRQGQRTLADHLNDMNRGPRGAGNRGPMVLVVDGRPIRNALYEMGESDPRYGVASRRSS